MMGTKNLEIGNHEADCGHCSDYIISLTTDGFDAWCSKKKFEYEYIWKENKKVEDIGGIICGECLIKWAEGNFER